MGVDAINAIVPATRGKAQARKRKRPRYIGPRPPNLSWKNCNARPKYAATNTPPATASGNAEWYGGAPTTTESGLACQAIVAVTSTMVDTIIRKTQFSARSSQ